MKLINDLLNFIGSIKYWLIGGVAAVAMLSIAGFTLYNNGLQKGRNESEVALANYERKVAELGNEVRIAQGKVTTKVVTEYRDRVLEHTKVVYRNNDIIIERTPEQFNFSAGWVHSYNQTLLGRSINPESAGNSTNSGISDAKGLITIADNNSKCVAAYAQLEALQTWVREIEKTNPNQ